MSVVYDREFEEHDVRKARVILDAVGPLSAEHAAAVEAAVLADAGGQTTSELRAAVTQAVLALDPDAMRRCRGSIRVSRE